MRNACAAVLLLFLAGCSRGSRTSDRDAIRQGVIDHLAGTNLNIAAMDVDVTSVKFDGGKADVMVTFRAKGAPGAPGMEMRYQMQQQGDRWAVTGTQDSGHSSQAPPGTANPHGAGGAIPPGGGAVPPGHPQTGGATPPSGQGSTMPSPEDLPPAGKK
jgi:hypothetical protein